MKRQYLGDFYDVVKRLWQEILSDWGPLYVEHAPFLFACSSEDDLASVAALLQKAGIPESRLEHRV